MQLYLKESGGDMSMSEGSRGSLPKNKEKTGTQGFLHLLDSLITRDTSVRVHTHGDL